MPAIYCGTKKVPSGKVKGSSVACFLQGRRVGFVGGISKNNVTKKEVIANGTHMGQRTLQSIAKALGLKKYGEKKAVILPRIIAHEWVSINAKDVLLSL